MKTWYLILFVLLFGCGKNSEPTSANPNPNSNLQTDKKIEVGTSLNLLCADAFNKTILSIHATWDGNSSSWVVNLEEKDSAQNVIFNKTNLVGRPDQIEQLHMNLSEGAVDYAQIVQVGKQLANYDDGTRNLDCTF